MRYFLLLMLSISLSATERDAELRKAVKLDRETLAAIKQQIAVLQKGQRERRLERVERYYDSAAAPLMAQEKIAKQQAIQEQEKFLKEYPNSPERAVVLLTLADLYFDSDTAKTIQFLNAFIKDYPDAEHRDAAYYLLGVSQIYEGNHAEAERVFKYFLNHFSKSAYLEEVRFRLGELYFENRDYVTAEKYFRGNLEEKQSPFYIKSLYKSAWISYLQNHYSQAIEQFSTLLDINSENKSLLKKEAVHYVAISLLESSSQPIVPHKPWARLVWIQLGDALDKADRDKEAAEAYQKAIQLDKGNQENLALDMKILALTPSTQVKKDLIKRYIDDPQTKDIVRPVLLDLALELHGEAKKTKKPEQFEEAAKTYALFMNHFPGDETLDKVIFYYAEASFDARLPTYAATAFEQLRDWPWQTEYRGRAAVNAVYAYEQGIKKEFPEFKLSELDVAKKLQTPSKIPNQMQGYVQAVDALAKNFPDAPEVPSFLLQAAGIYWAYGDNTVATQRLRQLAERYTKHETARLAANMLVSDSLASENWAKAAQDAGRFSNLDGDFKNIEQNARFKYANQLYAESKIPEDYQKAADMYLSILGAKPASHIGDKIMFNAGMALNRAHQYEKAKNLFEQLYVNYPSSPLAADAKEQQAIYFEQRLAFEKAASMYLKIPGSGVATLRAALDLEAAGNLREAAIHFERFVKEHPEAPEVTDAFLKAAKAYELSGDFSGQRRVLQAFEKRFQSKDARADFYSLEPQIKTYSSVNIDSKLSHIQAKQVTEKSKRLSALQQAYEQIIKNYELSPWTLASIYQIGTLYESLSEALLKTPCPDDVSKTGQAACEEYTGLLEEQAEILQKKALDAYQLVLDKSPKVAKASQWVLKSKGARYRILPADYSPAEALLDEPLIALGMKEEISEADAMRRLALEPFDAKARLQMARIFYQTHRLDAAYLTLEDSVENTPESSLFHLWLGHVNKAKGNYEQAIANYEKAIELQSDLPEAYDNLGLVYIEQGDLGKAWSNLHKAEQLLPNSGIVQLHLGNFFVFNREPEKAIKAYETALLLEPILWAAKLNSALVSLEQKNYVQAERDFKNYLEQGHPNAALKARIESYLKLVTQKNQLEKQRHENQKPA